MYLNIFEGKYFSIHLLLSYHIFCVASQILTSVKYLDFKKLVQMRRLDKNVDKNEIAASRDFFKYVNQVSSHTHRHTHTHTHTHTYIYIYIYKLSIVKNLLIARKTYRPREGVATFIIKICIYLNDRFRLALVKFLTPEEKFKRGNVKGKK